jgi:vacuolar-type H+-ATPase subunit F/Vma7
MKFFVLSDKPDVYLGMRLVGMDGAVVENRTEALDKIREIKAGERRSATVSIGVARGAESLQEAEQWARKALEMALGRLPVMTRISDRSGESATKGLERYVHESLGINL